MEKELLEEITACLRRDRTVFHYDKDRYALLLLEHVVRATGHTVCALKRTRYARLLHKPIVKALLARCGDGVLHASDIQTFWPSRPLAYRLTLGRWPLQGESWSRAWHQTTRRGHNLVVQLNFTQSHNRGARRILGSVVDEYQEPCHPVAGAGEITLGWVRIDLDIDTGEALIEEIQSDWMKEARAPCTCGDSTCSGPRWARYRDRVLGPHARLWDEALLAAAIWVLRAEIGIRRIFMHTFETGMRLKGMEDWPPPRSLYTTLPRRFCFAKTHSGPLFLKGERERRLKRALIDPRTTWQVLHL